MAFGSLTAATYGCLPTMYTRWQAGTLQADLTAFAADLVALFPDDNPNYRTVGNWFILIQALNSQLTASAQSVFDALSQALYRMFAQTNDRNASGQITNVQAAAVLTAANAHLS